MQPETSEPVATGQRQCQDNHRHREPDPIARHVNLAQVVYVAGEDRPDIDGIGTHALREEPRQQNGDPY